MLVALADDVGRGRFGDLLRVHGFTVSTVCDGAEALAAFESSVPDLVMLDLWLPDVSGIEVCCRLRRQSGVPIVMITRCEGVSEPEIGLDLGADHDVVWPQRPRELVARVRAVLRRAHAFQLDVSPQHPFVAADLLMDRDGYVASHGERRIQLTPSEFDLLERLALSAGHVVTRQSLSLRAWDRHYDQSTRRLESTIGRLRTKLVRAGVRSRIVTVRGRGLRYEPVATPP